VTVDRWAAQWRAFCAVVDGLDCTIRNETACDTRCLRCRNERLERALRAILAAPHGCSFCYAGRSRTRKLHDPSCGFEQARQALK